jgi:hypothetical protein
MANDNSRLLALRAHAHIATARLTVDLAADTGAALTPQLVRSIQDDLIAAQEAMATIAGGNVARTVPKVMDGPHIIFDDSRIRAERLRLAKKIQANKGGAT